MTKIHILQTGYTVVSPAVPNRTEGRSKFAYTGLFQSRKKRIQLPVKCFLVETDNKKVLIDTGWSSNCIKHPIKSIGFKLWFASEPVLTENETLESWFKQIGVSAEDLDAVILTHLDVDHASGLQDIKKAKLFYISEEEYNASRSGNLRYNKKLWKNICFELLKMSDDNNAPFGKSCDLFANGKIIVYLTPGHTNGELSIKVSDGEKFALITGDNGYNANSWNDLTLPGPVFDIESTKKSLAWVKLMQDNENCVGIYCAHDTAIEPQTVTIESVCVH